MTPEQLAAARRAVADMDRPHAVQHLREQGLSLQQTAEVLALSRARVWQLQAGWRPPSVRRVYVDCPACPWTGQRRPGPRASAPCPECGAEPRVAGAKRPNTRRKTGAASRSSIPRKKPS